MIGPVVICCLLLRFQFYAGIPWFGCFAPDYLAPAVVFFAFRYSKNQCYSISFIMGLFLDCFSLAPFGTQATLYLFFSYLCVCLKKFMYHEIGYVQVIWAGAVSFGTYFGNLALLRYHNFMIPAHIGTTLILRTLLTLFFSFPILLLLDFSSKWFSSGKRRAVSLRR
ncbi:MAG: rod shape-determining protein MreD [Planctomycetota bacterium]